MNKKDKKKLQQVLRKKLNTFFQNHQKISEECEIVYLMTQIRKILSCIDKKYNYVKFYCDWLLHVELTYQQNADFLSNIFKDIDFNKKPKEIILEMKSKHKDFFTLGTLKQQLIAFFNDCKLPTTFLTNNYRAIRKYILRIIQECPNEYKKITINKLMLIKAGTQKYYYVITLTNGIKLPKLALKGI